MDNGGFGDLLRQTREMKGFDLASTARRLRIRPDILKAIEDENFAGMPPRGYTRNMVNGYARFLGLNPTEVTGRYLDALANYQSAVNRSRAPQPVFDMTGAPGSTRLNRRSRTGQRVTVEADPDRRNGSGSSAGRRADARSGRTRRQPSGGGIAPQPASRTKRELERGYGFPNAGKESRGSLLPFSHFMNTYTSQNPLERRSIPRLPFIIAGAVLLVLVIVLCFFLFARPAPTTDATPTIPVTGGGENSTVAEKEEEAKEAEPTSFTLEFTVASGSQSWIEVYVDGEQQYAEVASGPVTKSFTSSGEIRFVSANPSAVTVKVDGTKAELTTGANGGVDQTFTFQQALDAWRKAHGVTTSSSSSSSTGSSSSAKSNTGSTSSAGTGSGSSTGSSSSGSSSSSTGSSTSSASTGSTGSSTSTGASTGAAGSTGSARTSSSGASSSASNG